MRPPHAALARASVLLAALGLLAGCALAPGGAPPWRGIIEMGVLAPLAGPATADGASLLTGARAAADRVNRAGGVDGYRVVVSAWDEGNPASAADLVADSDLLAVLGGIEPGRPDLADRFVRAGLEWLATEPVAAGPNRYPLVASPDQVDRALEAGLERDWALGSAAASDGAARCRAARPGGAIIPDGVGKLLCGLRPDGIAAALLATPPGLRVACVDGCDAPEIARWAGSARLEVVDPAAGVGPDAGARLAKLGIAAPVPRYAALGYDAGALFAAAATWALAHGELDRASVAAAFDRTSLSGVAGYYGPTGAAARSAEFRPASP